MHRVLLAVCASVVLAGAALHSATAQTIVDLTKPQHGKSRFVLNPDLTPATLGAAEEEKPAPVVAAVSRVPACGEGCKMEQPEPPREQRTGYRGDPNAYRTRSGTRVILVGGFGNGRKVQQTAKPAPAPRKTFRFRRR